MQIHELNSYTGAAGAGEYLALDNGAETFKINAENLSRIRYGISNSAASETTKEVACDGFVLQTGAMIVVIFTYNNSNTEAIYLNVNGTGAKRIRPRSGSTGATIWRGGSVQLFVYDGSSWLQADVSVLMNRNVSSLFGITSTTGTLNGAWGTRNGNVVTLRMSVKNSSSVAPGSNLFAGTMTGQLPTNGASAVTYQGSAAVIGQISAEGNIVARVVGATVSADSNAYLTFTYVAAAE